MELVCFIAVVAELMQSSDGYIYDTYEWLHLSSSRIKKHSIVSNLTVDCLLMKRLLNIVYLY